MNRRTITASRRSRVLRAVLAAFGLLVSGAAVASVSFAYSSAHDPRGSLEAAAKTPHGLEVKGWAYDMDNGNPLSVQITVNGKLAVTTLASLPRPDIFAKYPTYGPNRGFDQLVTLNPGTYKVCAIGLNRGLGSTTSLGCLTATVTWNPYGSFDSLTTVPGGFTVVGGATDVNAVAPISVDVSIDGTSVGTLVANDPVHGGHGYHGTFKVSQGAHAACITGINYGVGANAQLGCKSFVLNESPVGAITDATQVPNSVHVHGWAKDPDTTKAIAVTITIDGTTVGQLTANLAGASNSGYNFDATYAVTSSGSHTVCAIGINVSYGADTAVQCRNVSLQYNPVTGIDSLTQQSPGFSITGWAKDPDSSAGINVIITADGTTLGTVPATGRGTTHTYHRFAASYPLAAGAHKICVVGVNIGSGSNSTPLCQSITLDFNPFGAFESVTRQTGSTALSVKGWAIDPDTANPVSVSISVDGKTVGTPVANVTRTDVQTAHPGYGANHGFLVTYPANDGEHKVCATILNVAAGSNTGLGCKIINAVHPTLPSPPQSVVAVGGYGGATVTWSPPASDGGAPWSYYTVIASPSGISVKVSASTTTATVTGLKSNSSYVFWVTATNVAGTSIGGKSNFIQTQASPPPQTTPAPISTSRYIRNIYGASSTDLNTMRAEGAADAKANPSGHGYLILLDIGGQDQADGGVVLSATTRFVSYADLVADLKSYVDGYAGGQNPSAPVMIAIGTNNDMDVTSAAGSAWAKTVVAPIASYAHKYTAMTIAGANDIEPGFRGTYSATKNWLSGYLAGTGAPFVFNGSADGCSWTQTAAGCNNGWTMGGLYNLAAGAAPTRIVNLPQIYNNTMAAQWKYISLTGVNAGTPRVNFGGALTEWTACAQAGSCGSLTGNQAWTQMWNNLQSHPSLKVSSLPYSTDLRIDR